MTNAGAFTVTKIQSKAVNSTLPTLAGQTLRYDGAQWTPNFISMADLRSTITGASALTSCTSGQTLTWSAATDNLACSNITVTAASFSSQTANTFLAAPDGAAGTPAFRTIAAADLPNPSTTTLGGVQAVTAVANKWIDSISTTGVPNLSQPSFSDISGTASLTTQVTGTLSVANGGTGATSLAGTFALNGGQAGAVTVGSNDANALTLESNGAARMTILSGGNVGIGTTSPSYPLQIQKVGIAAGTTYDVVDVSESTTSKGVRLAYKTDSGGTTVQEGQVRSSGSVPLSLGTSTKPNAVYILDNGAVGIGTTAPSQALTVTGKIFPSSSFVSGTTNGSIIDSTTAAQQINLDGNNGILFMTGNTNAPVERMRIDKTTGNVGIGTTTPSQLLTVNGHILSTNNVTATGVLATSITGQFVSSSGNNEVPIHQQSMRVFQMEF